VPWKTSRPVDLRVEFVSRLQRGERMSELCREYEISRKTGHKLWKRYKALGVAGLEDQSRAPKHIPHRTTSEAVEAIVAMRKRYPNWGPKKLKDVLEAELGHVFPASSTIGDILRKHGFV